MSCPAYEAYRKSACQWCAKGAKLYSPLVWKDGKAVPVWSHMATDRDGSTDDWIPCAALSESDWSQREHEAREKLLRRLKIMCREWREVFGGPDENKTPGDVLERSEELIAEIERLRPRPNTQTQDEALRRIAFHLPTVCYEHDDRRYVDIEEVFTLKRIAADAREVSDAE